MEKSLCLERKIISLSVADEIHKQYLQGDEERCHEARKPSRQSMQGCLDITK